MFPKSRRCHDIYKTDVIYDIQLRSGYVSRIATSIFNSYPNVNITLQNILYISHFTLDQFKILFNPHIKPRTWTFGEN